MNNHAKKQQNWDSTPEFESVLKDIPSALKSFEHSLNEVVSADEMKALLESSLNMKLDDGTEPKNPNHVPPSDEVVVKQADEILKQFVNKHGEH